MTVVLHVVESLSSGVATALEAYVENRPADTEHVVYGYRRPGVQVGDGIDASARVVELPDGRREQLQVVSQALRTEKPDVVHVHSSWAGLAVRMMPSIGGARLVYTPHCYAFERQDLPRKTRAGIRALERVMARRTDVVAAVGEHEAELARSLGGGARVVVVPHTVPSRVRDELSVLRGRSDAEARTVCVLGRLSPQKDVDYFLAVVDAVNELVAERGARPYRFTWIGGEDANVKGGTDGLTSQLEARGVRVTGWVTRAEALDELSQAWAYLHTAAWEGFPLGIVEAAELDLPMVMRVIASLEEVDLPTSGHAPTELAHRLLDLDDPAAREASLVASRAFRETHQPAQQQAALARVYAPR